MGTAVSAMVRRALESFIEGKVEFAQAVLEMDNVIDRMRDDAFIQLVKSMNERPELSARRWTPCWSPAIWSASPTTPPTSPKTSSSGCRVRTFATTFIPNPEAP